MIIFHIAKPDNPVTLLGQIMGGSGVAFGHCSVCQIFVFFILTLFVVHNKMGEMDHNIECKKTDN